MSQYSPEGLVEKQAAAAQAPVSSRAVLVWTAWIATLLLSKLPLVIARDLLGSDIPWIVPIWIGIAVLFYAATYIWHTLEPLRRYFIIMGVILVITAWLDPILRATAVWHAFFDSQSQMVILFAERILIGVEALIVIGCLFLLGIKRRDSFIEVGNLKAPVAGRSTSTRKRPLTWLVFGPLMAVILGSLFFVFLNSQFPGAASSYRSVLPLLPLILLSAMLNAFGEEAMYRAAPLATTRLPSWSRPGTVDDLGLVRFGALLWGDSIRSNRIHSVRSARTAAGQSHAGHTRHGLVVDHPRGAGHGHLYDDRNDSYFQLI